ncbi:hypothetical protein OAO19_03055 [Gammaproteobacteria bacterium]|nr:hypothetical protein [Gammaproteobacteria bacterium]
MDSKLREAQEKAIANWRAKREKEQTEWLNKKSKGIWQPNCATPDFRTDEEIDADFLENGFQ